MRDVTRSRRLANAQQKLLQASEQLHEVDMRKCSLEQRQTIKRAIDETKQASGAVDEAIQHDAR